MQIKTTIGSREKLTDIIHNQALKTKEYVGQLPSVRELDEVEVRSTLDPNFWFYHNTLLRRIHREHRSLSGRLSAEEILAAGDRTVAYLGYVANENFRLQTEGVDVAIVISMDDYRQSVVGNQSSMQADYHKQSNAS